MGSLRVVRLVTLVLVGILAAVPALAAQAAASQDQGATPPPTRAPMSSAELDRIRRALEQEPILDLTQERLRFYASVVAQPFSPEKILGDKYDLIYGPTAGGAPMTHREFLDMVTPKELYSAAGIRPTDALQMAITGLVGQVMLQRAFESATDAWRARQIRELNARIDAELAALRERSK